LAKKKQQLLMAATLVGEGMSRFWGPRPALLAAAMLRRSQVCSALQPFGLWSGLRPRLRSAGPLIGIFSVDLSSLAFCFLWRPTGPKGRRLRDR